MTENTDFQAAIDKVRDMLSSKDGESQLEGLLNSLKTAGNEQQTESNADANPQESMGLASDILAGLGSSDVLSGLKNIMGGGMSEKDKNADFLKALKPFLKKERQAKIDNAAKVLSALKAFKMFKDSGLGGV